LLHPVPANPEFHSPIVDGLPTDPPRSERDTAPAKRTGPPSDPPLRSPATTGSSSTTATGLRRTYFDLRVAASTCRTTSWDRPSSSTSTRPGWFGVFLYRQADGTFLGRRVQLQFPAPNRQPVPVRAKPVTNSGAGDRLSLSPTFFKGPGRPIDAGEERRAATGTRCATRPPARDPRTGLGHSSLACRRSSGRPTGSPIHVRHGRGPVFRLASNGPQKGTQAAEKAGEFMVLLPRRPSSSATIAGQTRHGVRVDPAA